VQFPRRYRRASGAACLGHALLTRMDRRNGSPGASWPRRKQEGG
jgi:hypothetical protein